MRPFMRPSSRRKIHATSDRRRIRTGKDLIANAIHYNRCVQKPFIKVNCAALPKELIESELFGHTKGAFTGAHADKEGLCSTLRAAPDAGRIAEMPVELNQAPARLQREAIARWLREDLRGGFRLICAIAPEDAIRDGLLRDDLFYRISTITIHVPLSEKERRHAVLTSIS